MINKVKVFYKNKKAGELEKTPAGQFIFTYTHEYVQSENPSLSLTLPKSINRFESSDLFAFFDGLIPEGWLLNLATTELRLNALSDRFELLANLCHDTIGAVHIGEKSTTHSEQVKEPKTKTIPKVFGKCLICYEKANDVYHEECMINIFGKKIESIVNIDEEVLESLAKNQLNQKLALAGAQKKLSLELKDQSGKQSRMTVTDLWGKYIFKPRGGPPHLPENEHLCLKLAESFKIQVEKSALIPTTTGELGFIARRFDRDDLHNEFHQEDFCQILDKPTYKKYNASLEQIGKILRKESDFPGDNLYRLYEITIFNFIIGNVDAHLKNITLIYEDSTGPKKILGPGYDILSTDLYIEGDNEESALAINGKKNQLNDKDFLVLAKALGISDKVHKTLIGKFRVHLPIWDELIGKSFIDESKKEEFKQLIRRKLERFS